MVLSLINGNGQRMVKIGAIFPIHLILILFQEMISENNLGLKFLIQIIRDLKNLLILIL